MREENEMEFSGVYHKTSEQMSYALDEDRLIVNIKTGYDVKQVFIHYGDPYEAGILGGKENGSGKERKSYIKNVCLIRSGGQQRFFRNTKDANITLNCGRKRKSGIILRMVS